MVFCQIDKGRKINKIIAFKGGFMKKYIYVLLMALTTTAYAQNLLDNPGFEAWSSGMPDYWHKDDSILIRQEGIFIHGGNLSLKDSLFATTQAEADLFQGPVLIIPNTQYTYTLWVYDNDPAGRLRQWISWHTDSGWENNYSGSYSSDSPEWQQLIFDYTSPSDADSSIVSLRAYDVSPWDGDAVFYIDDAYFAPMVGVYESEISSHTMPIIRNPVIVGVSLASMINNPALYPITVYNTLGQIVMRVSGTKTKLKVPVGIYFLEFNKVEKGCAKLVVIK